MSSAGSISPPSPSSSSSSRPNVEILSGHLSKKSPRSIGVKAWQRRFFVLETNALSYYRDKKEHVQQVKPTGVIRMVQQNRIEY
jgi:hypothetical protein